MDKPEPRGAYFLPADYQPNTIEQRKSTIDPHSVYWTETRIQSSYDYQFGVYKHAGALIRKHGFQRVCDLGCGTGTKLRYLKDSFPKLDIVGIDRPEAIELCQKLHDFGVWLTDDLEGPRLPIPESKPDLIICSDVIEHMENPTLLLDYTKRLVAPGGLILLSTPDRGALYRHDVKCPSNPEHIREWTFDEFKNYLEHEGFHMLDHFNDYPLRLRPTKWSLNEIFRLLKEGRRIRYNQVCIVAPIENSHSNP